MSFPWPHIKEKTGIKSTVLCDLRDLRDRISCDALCTSGEFRFLFYPSLHCTSDNGYFRLFHLCEGSEDSTGSGF